MKLKRGDVVVIEWKPVHPHIEHMKKYDGCIGVVEGISVIGTVLVSCSNLWTSEFMWHPSSLTKIGKL